MIVKSRIKGALFVMEMRRFSQDMRNVGMFSINDFKNGLI